MEMAQLLSVNVGTSQDMHAAMVKKNRAFVKWQNPQLF